MVIASQYRSTTPSHHHIKQRSATASQMQIFNLLVSHDRVRAEPLKV
jgi:hypothetical protein